MAMVVLAVAASGIFLPFSSAASIHVEATRLTLAAKLAADLVEEITISLEEASDDEYDGEMTTWNDFYEAEGEVAKYNGDGNYSGDVYSYFSRKSDCVAAVLGSERNTTVLGAWVTVTVSFDGREMVTLKTLVSNSN